MSKELRPKGKTRTVRDYVCEQGLTLAQQYELSFPIDFARTKEHGFIRIASGEQVTYLGSTDSDGLSYKLRLLNNESVTVSWGDIGKLISSGGEMKRVLKKRKLPLP